MSSIYRDVLDMLETAGEQGYRVVDKSGGTYVVHAPLGRQVNPEYRAVTVHMPRSDGGNAIATIRQNLKRAGVNFELPVVRKNESKAKSMTSKLTESPVAKTDPIEELCAIFNLQADLAAKACGLLDQLKKQIRDKTSRADEVVAAFELLRKATDPK